MQPPRQFARISGSSVLARAAALGLLLAACASPAAYKAEADDEVYALIEARRAELFSDGSAFTIEPPADSLRARLLRGEASGIPPLRLTDCLEIAAENSREYQDQKESFYLDALDLTLERWRFSNQYGGTASASLDGDGDGAQNASADGALSLSRLLGTGATIAASIGESLFRVVSTGDGWDLLSTLSLSVTQPLLRGAGASIVEEPLTQAERNLVYGTRSFERFRRTFAVDVARRFYALLLTLDSVNNERENVASLELIRKRNEALAQAGRLSDIQVDQARQDELSSRNRLVVLESNYQTQIDDFKLFLGLPIETRLAIDSGEQQRLSDEMSRWTALLEGLEEEPAMDLALSSRLDYLTARDRVADSERGIHVAADALGWGADVSASVTGTSEEGRPAGFRSSGIPWSASFGLDLPLDRLPERNSYRAALIAREASRRTAERLGDSIRANLRDEIRDARATLESYRLQENSVHLAQRRVESARLNLEAGRADTRDLLEAQDALLRAQNARTAAMVDFTLAHLNLYLEMEALFVDEQGISVDNDLLARVRSQDE